MTDGPRLYSCSLRGEVTTDRWLFYLWWGQDHFYCEFRSLYMWGSLPVCVYTQTVKTSVRRPIHLCPEDPYDKIYPPILPWDVFLDLRYSPSVRFFSLSVRSVVLLVHGSPTWGRGPKVNGRKGKGSFGENETTPSPDHGEVARECRVSSMCNVIQYYERMSLFVSILYYGNFSILGSRIWHLILLRIVCT